MRKGSRKQQQRKRIAQNKSKSSKTLKYTPTEIREEEE